MVKTEALVSIIFAKIETKWEKLINTVYSLFTET